MKCSAQKTFSRVMRFSFAVRLIEWKACHSATSLAWVCSWLCLSLNLLAAESPEEAKAFNAAVLFYKTEFYEQAEGSLADFVQKFPNSERVPEALLLRAQALLKLKNYNAAIDVLAGNRERAGPLADQYQLSLAEAHFQTSNYVAAASAFALLLKDFTNSPVRLRAAYGEAQTRFKLKDWPRVIDLLQNSGGAFQQIATTSPNEGLVIQGHLLLVEALLEQRNVRDAQAILDRLSEQPLTPDLDWHRQFLLCRTLLASGRAADALSSATNLLAIATATGRRGLVAESVAMKGDILGQLTEDDAAAAAYEMNQTEGTTIEKQHQAFLRIVELLLAQNRIADAAKRLENFFNKYPTNAASDIALLTLGELRLKEHYSGLAQMVKPEVADESKPATNLVAQALAQFDKLLNDFPQSPWIGKAQLDRGWCFWAQGRIPECILAFQSATNLLSHSEELAVARFKLADAQFLQNDLTNALRNFRLVLNDSAGWPRLRDELVDHSWYQILQINLTQADEQGATDAMNRIVQNYPLSSFADRSLLLLGQAMTRWNHAAKARALFEQFLAKYPNSRLLPQVHLAIARTYVDEQNWEAAIKKYEEAAARFSTPDIRPGAEYYRALMYSKAGSATNALNLFTNFVVQFPTNELAPFAQYWVADFYWNQKNFFQAQKEYQRLFENTNWPISELMYQARLMAGQSALARQDYKVADTNFTDLINVLLATTNRAPDLLAEAWLKLGDTITEGSRLDPVKPLDSRFGEAINAFARLTQAPTNRFTAVAWGRIGDCHLQLASQSPDRYTNAITAYQNAVQLGDVAVRSQAELGWGSALEKLAALPARSAAEREALLKDATNHYLNVLFGTNLRAERGETLDPFWFKQSGLSAGRLAEANGQLGQAIKL